MPQIGVSRSRIDLGVVHPDRPGGYLAGVECDGATYHLAATARDRDKVRAAILTGLGWRLVRVWSTDWWVDKRGSLDRLDGELKSLLERSRKEAEGHAAATPLRFDEEIGVSAKEAEIGEVEPTPQPAEAYARSPGEFDRPSCRITRRPTCRHSQDRWIRMASMSPDTTTSSAPWWLTSFRPRPR